MLCQHYYFRPLILRVHWGILSIFNAFIHIYFEYYCEPKNTLAPSRYTGSMPCVTQYGVLGMLLLIIVDLRVVLVVLTIRRSSVQMVDTAPTKVS